MTIISAIAVFCLLILSHELGHFLAARACGVLVDDFSLGMGPKLVKWQGRETQYTLRLLPIGGWCKMVGEDEDNENPRAFCNKKVSQRILVIAAGPLMNFIMAILIFIVYYMMLGAYSPESLVGSPLADSPAQAAGLRADDRIVAIDQTEITTWNQISTTINARVAAAGEQPIILELAVEREGELLSIPVAPYYDAEAGRWLVGIQPATVRQNVFTAIELGIKSSYYFTRELIMALVGMFSGTTPVEVAGPVGIVDIIGDATDTGLRSLLLLTGLLSINLGLINLFPLPALDGSRIVFLAIEGLRGRPFNREREGMVHFIGLMLLMGLMLLITYQDIMRLISGA